MFVPPEDSTSYMYFKLTVSLVRFTIKGQGSEYICFSTFDQNLDRQRDGVHVYATNEDNPLSRKYGGHVFLILSQWFSENLNSHACLVSVPHFEVGSSVIQLIL